MPRWFDLPRDLRTQAEIAVAEVYVRDFERAGRQAIVSTFQRKLPRELPGRWTEVTHVRALKPRADLVEPQAAGTSPRTDVVAR